MQDQVRVTSSNSPTYQTTLAKGAPRLNKHECLLIVQTWVLPHHAARHAEPRAEQNGASSSFKYLLQLLGLILNDTAWHSTGMLFLHCNPSASEKVDKQQALKTGDFAVPQTPLALVSGKLIATNNKIARSEGI